MEQGLMSFNLFFYIHPVPYKPMEKNEYTALSTFNKINQILRLLRTEC